MAEIKPTGEQLRIVNHDDGHSRVIAVPGSGKTSTLVLRVAELIKRGTNPASIQVLAFNKAAVADFKKQLTKCRLALDVDKLVATHHTFAKRLVESHGALDTSWVFLGDGKSSRRLMKQAASQVNGSLPDGDFVKRALNWISLIKANAQSIDEGLSELAALHSERADCIDLETTVRTFELLRISERKRFQDDLTPDALQLLQHTQDSHQQLAHLIVDEYQDINEAQHRLLLASAPFAEVMVVGDPNQCIYQWRGAQPTFMTERFTNDYGKSKTYTLSRSFRLGHHAALCANALIAHNSTRTDQSLCIAANSEPFGEVKRVQSSGQLVQEIVNVNQWLRSYSEVAVLARHWTDLVSVQLEMVLQDVPYRLENEEKGLLNDRTFRILRAALAFSATEINERHGDARAAILIAFSEYLGQSRIDTARSVDIHGSGWVTTFLGSLRSFLGERSAGIVRRVGACLNDCVASKPQTAAAELLGSRAFIELLTPTLSRERDVEARDNAADVYKSFVGLAATREWTVWQASKTAQNVQSDASSTSGIRSIDKVTLTTIHAAKGREWPFVAVVTPVNETRKRDSDSLEEERLIWYVAITRAIEEAWILSQDESMFVREMQVSASAQVVSALSGNAPMPSLGKGSYGNMVRKYMTMVEGPDQMQTISANLRPTPSLPRLAAPRALVAGDTVLHPRLNKCTVVAVLDYGRKAKLRRENGDDSIVVISLALSAGMKVLP